MGSLPLYISLKRGGILGFGDFLSYFEYIDDNKLSNSIKSFLKTSLKDKRSSYPVLKFFKGNTLLEFGYNNKTDWDIHLMYRF